MHTVTSIIADLIAVYERDNTTKQEVLEVLRELDTINTNEMTRNELQCQAMTDKMNDLANQLTNANMAKETAQGEANLHYQLEDMIADWCSDNDCEPEDTQALTAEMIDEHLPALFDELSKRDTDGWGKMEDWKVDVAVTYTGTVTVRAKNKSDAKAKAEEEAANDDIDKDDLYYDSIEVNDAYTD